MLVRSYASFSSDATLPVLRTEAPLSTEMGAPLATHSFKVRSRVK
jgi:hypothetical protein